MCRDAAFLHTCICKHYSVGTLLFIYGDLVHIIILGKQTSKRFPQLLEKDVLRFR